MKFVQMTQPQLDMINEAGSLLIKLVERAAREQGVSPNDHEIFHAGFSIAFGGLLSAYQDAHPDHTGCIPRAVGHVLGQIAGREENPLVRLQIVQAIVVAFNEGVEATSIIHDPQGSA